MIRFMLLFLFLCSSAEAALVPTATLKWNPVSENIDIKCMTSSGEYIWCGTDDGVYKFHSKDGAFERFTSEDGLPDRWVNCIAADSSGTVWFGSSEGTASYRDSTFRNYGVSDGLLFTDIKALAVSSDGNLWILEKNGIFSAVQSFDGSLWKTHFIGENIKNGALFSLAVDHSGDVWIGGEGRVIKLKSSGETEEIKIDDPGNVISVAVDKTGMKWFATEDSLYSYDGTILTNPENGFCSYIGKINKLFIDKNNAKWIATSNGLVEYRGYFWNVYHQDSVKQSGTTEESNYSTRLTSNLINCLITDKDNNLFLGTSEGLCLKNGFYFDPFHTSPRECVNKIVSDNENSLWFGSWNCAWNYDGSRWKKFAPSNSGLPADSVLTVDVDPLGRIWFGTYKSGAVLYDGESWFTNNKSNSGLIDNNVTDIACDSKGNTWFLSPTKISYFDGELWKNFPNLVSPSDLFKSIEIDSNDRAWVGYGKGVLINENLAWSGIISAFCKNIKSIYKESEKIVLGGESGLTFYNTNEPNYQNSQINLGGADVKNVTGDINGGIWFADYARAYYLNDTTFIRINSAELIEYRVKWINDLFVDKNNTVWAATNKGLYSSDAAFVLLLNPFKTLKGQIIYTNPDSLYSIEWAAPGSDKVRLEYSLDKGSTWNSIATVEASAGNYLWDSSNVLQGNDLFSDAIIKVTSVEHPELSSQESVIVENKNMFTGMEIKSISPIYDISEDSKGDIWICSSKAVWRYSNGVYEKIDSKNNGIPAAEYIDCVQDRDGIMWFATSLGVIKYDGVTWEILHEGGFIFITVDDSGNIWAAQTKYIYKYDGSSWESIRNPLTPAQDYFGTITALGSDKNGTIWICCERKIYSYDGVKWNPYWVWGTLPYCRETDFRFGNENSIMMITPEDGIYKLLGTAWSKMKIDSDFNPGNYYCFDISDKGHIWCSTTSGQFFYDGLKWNRATFAGSVSEIFIDSRNKVWIYGDGKLFGINTIYTPVETEETEPSALKLSGNYPNPFNSRIAINYEIPKTSRINLAVYNLLGQKIRALVSDNMNAGRYTSFWDGKDESGINAASGLYLIVLESSGRVVSSRITLLK